MIRARGPLSGRLRSKTPHWLENWPAGDAAVGENLALVRSSTSSCGTSGRKLRIDRKSGRCRLACVAAMLAILLAGCAGPPMGSEPTAPVASPTEVVPTPESTADLAAMKKAAGRRNTGPTPQITRPDSAGEKNAVATMSPSPLMRTPSGPGCDVRTDRRCVALPRRWP